VECTPVDDGRPNPALEVVAAGAELTRVGLILPGEGNLSARIDSGRFLITPTGVDKGRLSAADLVLVSLNGGVVPAGASRETMLHVAVYQALSGVAAIVHAHPPAALALTAGDWQPGLGGLVEGGELLGPVARVGPHPPGSRALAEAVRVELGRAPACLLEGHGAVTVGATMGEAMRRMLLLEEAARLGLAAENR
jgi:L-fuculose-phosphate aldolase